MDNIMKRDKAYFHLPGLFEFYEFYREFLPLFYNNREYFYEWCDIASIYGAPSDCIWAGGRTEDGNIDATKVLDLLNGYGISARLTFSNSLLSDEHLLDKKCNRLCALFESKDSLNGVIVHSDLLLEYLKSNYPGLYHVSSTTKVITDFNELIEELRRDDFEYVVPDFRFNKSHEQLNLLTESEKGKIEFLCNECCFIGCKDRRVCYENVSRRILGEECDEHRCSAPNAKEGYRFSEAMKNPAFIGIADIKDIYLPNGFINFKIEGRGLGNAILLEFLLYYMTKPEYQLVVREKLYLDSMLSLF